MKAYICLSYYYDKKKYKTAPTVYQNISEAYNAINHSVARTMTLLTKTRFSIYSNQNDVSEYDFVIYGDRALIFKLINGKYRVFRCFTILEIDIPDYRSKGGE